MERKIVNYYTVARNSIRELNYDVRNGIEIGLQPIGPMILVPASGQAGTDKHKPQRYAQTMVLYDNEKASPLLKDYIAIADPVERALLKNKLEKNRNEAGYMEEAEESKEPLPDTVENEQTDANDFSGKDGIESENMDIYIKDMDRFNPKYYLYCSELRPNLKERVARIDETPSMIELTEALASKKYRLLRLERLDPEEDDIFLIKIQDVKPNLKEKGARIDETPSMIELTEALATKGYELLRLERLDPKEDDIFVIKVRDMMLNDRKLGTLENPIQDHHLLKYHRIIRSLTICRPDILENPVRRASSDGSH